MHADSDAGPLVTIAIACYDQGRFLGEAIESALGQTYPHIEVVVVDDGSTDDTPTVATRYAGVRLVRQPNAGLSAARNTGLRVAEGAFVVFLDADDRLCPYAVAAGLACFEEYPESAFVSGDHVRIRADGTHLAAHDPPAPDTDPYRRLLRGNYIGMHATVMYRRVVLAAAGGFDPSLPACEDYDVYLRLARAHPIAAHEAIVAEYRIHEQNMSGDPTLMLRTVLRVLRRQRKVVNGDPQREAAYRDGLIIWKAYYGDMVLDRLRAAVRAGAPSRQALKEGVALARHAPRLAIREGKRLVRRVAGRVLRAVPAASSALGSRSGETPPVGHVDFGDLRRTEPISRVFGFDRGLPVDRYYIEAFLARHAADVHGRTLEIGDDMYTRRFGGTRIEQADILHAHAGNARATFIGDLTQADRIPSDAFDCIILTQTLHLIYDLDAAVATLHRILKPGGVLLATVPGISQIEDGEWGDTWYWSFTRRSAWRLLRAHFAESGLAVEAHGNVLAAIAFLHGVAAEELEREELDAEDALYPLLITVRAQKPEAEP